MNSRKCATIDLKRFWGLAFLLVSERHQLTASIPEQEAHMLSFILCCRAHAASSWQKPHDIRSTLCVQGAYAITGKGVRDMTLSSRGNDERACAVLEVGSLDRKWEQTHRLHVSTIQTVDALVPAGGEGVRYPQAPKEVGSNSGIFITQTARALQRAQESPIPNCLMGPPVLRIRTTFFPLGSKTC